MRHHWKVATLFWLAAFPATAAIAGEERVPRPREHPQLSELKEVPAELRSALEEKTDRVMRETFGIVQDGKTSLPVDERERAVAAWQDVKHAWMNVQEAGTTAWLADWQRFEVAWRRFERRWDSAGGASVPALPAAH